MAVDFDAQPLVVAVVEQAQAPPARDERAAVGAVAAQLHGHDEAVEVDAVAPGADRVDVEAIRLAAMREIDALTRRRGHRARTEVARVEQQLAPRPIAVALVGEHRGGAQRRHRVRPRPRAQRGLAVEPFGVDLARGGSARSRSD